MNSSDVQIICDSVSSDDRRLTTFQLRYWRAIHAELLTHRMFSRNAGSSRARPTRAIIEQVRNNPWGPLYWGANQPGMQAGGLIQHVKHAEDLWKESAKAASHYAECLVTLNVHKQIVNRILEPYTYIDVVLTATDFNNWFALRDHSDAQPEIRELAQNMRQKLEASKPQTLSNSEWHLPYILPEDWDRAHKFLNTKDYFTVVTLLRKISAARCARVSYKAFDGTVSSFEKDLELFEKLLVNKPLHASPAEHQAKPSSYTESWCSPNIRLQGNFSGWIQHRKLLENEWVPG